MKVTSGARLGSYEILSALGAGGMGEVWEARDTKLHRHVAIKTLPVAMAQDPNRLARFAREAELLASLNHPNIATIHGLDEHDGTRFLVLELVTGGTLENLLLQGPLSVKEALKLALQIAEALDAAHEKGVVHRDLKPANISVTPEGRIKVLDFGLAKALGPASTDLVTQTAMCTAPGIALGTPAYMSPEQARGESAGPQADIWSFGAVMYELLTGASPFRQKTTAETVAKLLEAEPDFAALPADTPASVRRLIRRCLEKDRKRRLHHMGDVRIEIEDALAALDSPQAQETTRRATTRRRWLWATGVLLISALAGLAGWLLAVRSRPAASDVAVHLSMPFFDPLNSGPVGMRRLAISHDGSRVAYAARTRLVIRRMDRQNPTAVTEEEGSDPFFSPDGKWVSMFSGPGLIKVPVEGGPPVVIVRTSARPAGAAWGMDGTIVFATTEGLFQVSQDGGEPRLLVQPARDRQERLYAWPHFLPGGRSVLFTVVLEGTASECQIALLDLKTLEQRTVLKGGSSAHFVRTGHLVYAAGRTMKAVGFDPDAGRVLDDPISLAEIDVAAAADNGAADFALSENGTLVFISASSRTGLRTLEWISRGGERRTIPVEPNAYGYPRLSPDGTRVALDINRGGNRDIWILNLERLSLTRLTDGPTEDMLPVWSRDGRRVFFASNRTGNFDVYSQPADGASGPRVEFASPGTQVPDSFTPDGGQLIVYEEFKDTSVLRLESPERLTPLLNRPDVDERLGKVSPDGHWIVYESDESGKQFEIFLRPFPKVEARREKISIDGGRFPLWGPPGSNELYYVNLNGEMMAVSIMLTPALKLGAVTKLFDFQKPPTGRSGVPYDVASDGRFLTTRLVAADSQAPTQVSVVLKWADELRRQMAPH